MVRVSQLLAALTPNSVVQELICVKYLTDVVPKNPESPVVQKIWKYNHNLQVFLIKCVK